MPKQIAVAMSGGVDSSVVAGMLQARGESVIGEFNRKLTVLDRYVLDMSADPQHTVDRRIALALGVMLDTGERR